MRKQEEGKAGRKDRRAKTGQRRTVIKEKWKRAKGREMQMKKGAEVTDTKGEI